MSQDQVSEQVDAMQISQGQILNITLLASEWNSSAGGLTTLNRELAIHLSQIQNVRVSLLVPEGACNELKTKGRQDVLASVFLMQRNVLVLSLFFG